MTAPDHQADALRAETAGALSAEPSPAEQPADEEARLQLFSYLQAPERRTYLAIMRLFTSTLLADLSAGEVAAALADVEREGRIAPGESNPETVIDRLKQLVKWGNLVVGRRETIASSIAEFQHGSVRYQVSKLAVRVQREVDVLLRVPEGAREVSRELLPAIDRGLRSISTQLSEVLAAEQRDPRARSVQRAREQLAGQVTTVFLQHTELAATVRDFYAYLGQVVNRHQLAPDEISGFRNLLVEYIQMVVEDVLRHTESLARSLTDLAGRRDELLRQLGPAEQLGGEVERARGRSAADWQELTDWFVDSPGRPSQVSALREATARAIGALLASVKRATAGSVLAPSRRGELLKLAKWFDEATPERAEQLYAAAFGLHSARHLFPAPEYDADNEDVPWRDGPVQEVSVSVRARSDRSGRGKTSRVLDDPMTEVALRDRAREADRRRSAAFAELAAAASRLPQTRLSADALEVFCELLTLAMAAREQQTGTGSAFDPVHRVRLTVSHAPGTVTEVRSAAGSLTLQDTAVRISGEDVSTGVAG